MRSEVSALRDMGVRDKLGYGGRVSASALGGDGMSSLLARVPDPIRNYLNSWRFWNAVAFAGIAAAMVVGFYSIAVQNRQAEQSRDDLCAAVNATRALLKQVLVQSEAQTLANASAPEDVILAYFKPLIALAHPVDCSEVVS